MKKRLFLGILALAAVAVSCSKDVVVNEVPQDQAIEFGTYLGRDALTKGTVINDDNLGSNGFGVFAYYTTEKYDKVANAELTPNFMINQKVYKEQNEYTYSPKKYWPENNEFNLSFFAYGPYDSEALQENNTTPANDNITSMKIDYGSNTGNPIIEYELPASVSEHKDIIYAKNIDITSKPTDNNGKVKFHFLHALSRIAFYVQAANTYENTTITVEEVILSGKFYSNGRLNLNTSTYEEIEGNVITSKPQWNLDISKKYDFSVTANNSGVIANNSTKTVLSSNYIMIFPQEFEANKLEITVKYKVKYTDTVLEYNNIEKTYNTEALNLLAGKAYAINLSIGLDAIEFSANVEPWPTETNISANGSINI